MSWVDVGLDCFGRSPLLVHGSRRDLLGHKGKQIIRHLAIRGAALVEVGRAVSRHRAPGTGSNEEFGSEYAA